MIELIVANKNYSSWSLRPWLLLTELEIPFTERMVYFDGNSNFEEFRKFAPNGKVPCLHDGKLTVWDSLAICEYLSESHKPSWPVDPIARAWARCASAEMHSGFNALRNICGMSVGVRATLKEIPDDLIKDMRRINEIWNEGLDNFGGQFLAGDKFTVVDAFYAPVVYRVRTFGLKLEGRSLEYYERMLSLKSMKTWEAEALAETVRDPDHESEMLNVADVTADYRAK